VTKLARDPLAPEGSPRFVRLADGRRLAYCEYGDPGGRASLYCHGFPSSRIEARLLHEEAKGAGVRVISPDRPGYGDSDPDPQRTLLKWAEDILGLADQLALHAFDLIGVSGGGPYALACLARIPERVRACALVCPLGPIYLDPVRIEMRLVTRVSFTLAHQSPDLARLLHGGALPALIAASPWLIDGVRTLNAGASDRAALQDRLAREVLTRSVQEAMRVGARGARQDLALYTQPWNIDFGALTQPIALWHGDADNTVPLAHARWYAEHLAGCSLRILPGEGHYSLPLRHGGDILRSLEAESFQAGPWGAPADISRPEHAEP
jgi:pimeloyl-ACP methyl ester carboxylesterase